MTTPQAAPQIHNVPAAEVLTLLATRPAGLVPAEVEARQREFGFNELTVPSRLRWPRMLLRHFGNFFSLLLDVSAALCFLAEWLRPGESMALLGTALLVVAVLNGLFAFAQEYRAERAMDELRKFLPRTIRVRRAGTAQDLLATALVPGDILLLAEGDQVPADARLVHCEGLLVSNAPLTGESRPVALTAEAVAARRLCDAPNIALAGAAVLRGHGEAVVFGTGRRTEFGKIALLSHQVERPPSPLEREVVRMSRLLTIIATAMGLSFFTYGVLTGQPLLTNLVFMMGIIVANVPEGLLPTLTLALSMGSLRMARKQVLVKSLEAVETLGALHVICTDKTGTLTTDRLSLADAVTAEGQPAHGDQLVELLRLALIASEVRPAAAAGSWSGDPLDVAVAQRFADAGEDAAAVVRDTRRHFPFDVRKRRQGGWYQPSAGGDCLFAVKGAWEAVREASTVSSDAARSAHGETIVTRLAEQGYRVIAVAVARWPAAAAPAWHGPLDAVQEQLEHHLELVGFLAWEDPVRPTAPAALDRCRSAGIRVIMITGDHPDTAAAIGRRIGLIAPGMTADACCVRGEELEQLREADLRARLRDGVTIFARTTPEQKFKIVSALMQDDLVVGMTGDGVNDAPALKAADVGIAMGVGGTDVAREAADIILLDNNFASIVAGVEEGRAIFRNIQRFTDYVLASNVPEIVPYLLYILFPVPLALTILQILSIDLGTDILPAIGLGQEAPEPELMEQPPRRRDERLLSPSVLCHAYLFFGPCEAAIALSLFFLTLSWGGWHWGEPISSHDPLYRSATGVTLATVVLLQMANLLGRRRVSHSGWDRGLWRNGVLLAGLALEVAFVIGLLAWSPLQRVLGTGPLPLGILALALLAVPAVFLLDLGYKTYRQQQTTRHHRQHRS